jgi:hypothetical protein
MPFCLQEDGGSGSSNSSSGSGASDGGTPQVLKFASLVHVQGSAGAALIQRSTLNVSQTNMTRNSAGWAAGGLLMQQQWQLSMANSHLENNRVAWGSGGGLVMRGPTGSGDITDSNFVTNEATVGSGGAVAIDSGLGPLELHCQGCQFAGNKAGLVSCAAMLTCVSIACCL